MFSPSLALGLFYVIVGASMQRMTLADLRRYLRHTRRQLSAASRRQAGRQVADQLRRHPNIQAAQHIGIYLDDFGEVPTSALILQLLAQGKTVYLPVIRPFDQRLVFVPICMQQYRQRRFYQHRLGMLEPRTGLIWGGVELGISSAATVQLGHYYGFAVNVYGFSTNAHTLDAQNAFERGLNASLPALAGADELSGIGEMEAGVMGSFAQMVLDNELAKSVHRQRQGLSADAEHLAVEIIGNVMDSNRNYLASKHTLKHLRAGEMALTKLAERNSWDTWEDKMGRKQMADHATDEAERILREHQVPPLEAAQEAELDKILAAAERETVKKK